VTTNLTWRLVFAGEVVVVIAILLCSRLIREPARAEGDRRLDLVGSVLSALGLSLIVFGVLQASNWGWLEPRDSPIEPFGFSLVPFVIAAGAVVLYAFRAWERRREEGGKPPLVHFALLSVRALRSGLTMFCAQNLILLGIFFTIPLYLQVVQGFDAFETGVRMLPVSIAMLLTAAAGGALAARFSPRTMVRAGLTMLLIAVVLLLGTIDPQIDDFDFAVAMAVLGVGMGLLVSQLGNVVQTGIREEDRSEVGGLQFTAQQLGAALGTALIGAVLITGLIGAFSTNVNANPQVSQDARDQVGIALQGKVSFVTSDQVAAGAADAGLSSEEADAVVSDYEDAQLRALKTALLAAGFVVLAAFMGTRGLPRRPLGEAT
jgi:Na+/melibiose symporter-like transporter